MWGACLATFCYMYFVYFCMTWMPTYFKERHGLSLTDSGWFTFMSFGGMATVAILGGWAADRLIGRGLQSRHGAQDVRNSGVRAGVQRDLRRVYRLGLDDSVLAVFSLSGLGLTTANYWALTQTLMPAGAIGRVAGFRIPPPAWPELPRRGSPEFWYRRPVSSTRRSSRSASGWSSALAAICFLFGKNTHCDSEAPKPRACKAYLGRLACLMVVSELALDHEIHFYPATAR